MSTAEVCYTCSVFHALTRCKIINLLKKPDPVIPCPPLSSIADGQVTVPTRTPGSLATYTCNSGYVLVGNDIRTCLASGVWSGTEPFCSQGIHFGISVTEHSNS